MLVFLKQETMTFRSWILPVFLCCCGLPNATAVKQRAELRTLLEVSSSGHHIWASDHQLKASVAHDFKEPSEDKIKSENHRSVRQNMDRSGQVRQTWEQYVLTSKRGRTKETDYRSISVSVPELLTAIGKIRRDKLLELPEGETLTIPIINTWLELTQLLNELGWGLSASHDQQISYDEFSELAKKDTFSQLMGLGPRLHSEAVRKPVDPHTMIYLRWWLKYFRPDGRPIDATQFHEVVRDLQPIDATQFYAGLQALQEEHVKGDNKLGTFSQVKEDMLDYDRNFGNGDGLLSFDEFVGMISRAPSNVS